MNDEQMIKEFERWVKAGGYYKIDDVDVDWVIIPESKRERK